MAKKRKRQDEIKEERGYKPPEFDRREYVKTEMGVSKATILAAIFSVPMGLVAAFVMPVGGLGGGLLVGLAGIGMLWFLLPGIGIEVAPFKPMNWVGIMSTYFLVFLMVWVVLCNPPFNDLAAPEIRNVRVGWTDGTGNMTWENVSASGLSGDLQVSVPANANITILAQITDNVRVGNVMIARGSGEPVGMEGPQERGGAKYLYAAEFDGVSGETFTITAGDVNGHSAEYIFIVSIQ